MIDPDFFNDGENDGEDYGDNYDTYDRIVGEEEIERLSEGDDYRGMSSEHWGMAFALADEIAEEERLKKSQEYELDENTDEENYRQAMLQNPFANQKPESNFDRIINEICSGRRSIFDKNY
jgi:hypothetical protein